MEEGTKTSDERKSALGRAVANRVAAGGMRIESQSDFNAVLVKGGKTNHVLHLILTLITFGLWAIVWIVMLLINKEQREMISIDEYGNVNVERL